ncbi:MAG: 3-deoxy-manno-octulosonate-8-phosphatase KdsC [Gammaproteobacteria bacterium]|nr:3-deoxy-manno-octulosonate-8-phosphatase KdsC [Gammaproteobacteria bacterium]
MDLILKKAAQIKLVIFDVDGVLTDGSLFIGDDGQEYKAFNSKDGLGMKMLQSSGVPVGIITARKSNVVKLRMESLGIEYLYQGQQEKLPAFEQLLEKLSLDAGEVAYVGDDLIDLPVMIRAGLAIAVADSHERVIEQAHWVTEKGGGRGAAREVCELIMSGQGTFESTIQKFFE